jgi:hypothetical protein
MTDWPQDERDDPLYAEYRALLAERFGPAVREYHNPVREPAPPVLRLVTDRKAAS